MPPSSSFSLITIQCVKVMTLVFWTIFLCSTAHWIKPEMFCTKKTNDKWYNIGKWKQCTTINFTLWKQHKSGSANHKYVAKSRSIFHDFLFLHIHSHCPRLFLVTNIKVLQLLLLKIEVLSVASYRGIFQTFWKLHCCTKSFSFFELETSNYGYLLFLFTLTVPSFSKIRQHWCYVFYKGPLLWIFGRSQNQKTSKGGTLIKCLISMLSHLAETLRSQRK